MSMTPYLRGPCLHGYRWAAITIVAITLVAATRCQIALLAQEAMATTKIIREGSRLENVEVMVRSSGQRLSIKLAAEDRTMLALENLAAQRILKAVIEDPDDGKWTIDATVTEFVDSNFVLIERAQRGVAK